MFQLTDAQFHLDLHRQRAGEWQRSAAADHLAHQAVAGRHRARRWRWPTRRPRPVRVPAAS
ncbi:hypothetical protein GCM10020358_70240 [Amorphoplanes nipponensis]|uniref:Uncharacterized protein n=1 Tax=Actinoplanes nipponensis TaxID=135950 RepID=A0A919JHK8_9ACTN|nr:hypothetical protein [Actinoplanes nipponensis]GIE51149.1 hypothetical protein Ani05nite_46830 [Actinoplanes nipponensis]